MADKTQNRRQFLIKGAIGASTLAGLSGCTGSTDNGSDDNSGKPLATGNIVSAANPYNNAVVEGFEDAADALGYKSNIQVNEADVNKQLSQLNTAVQQETDVIFSTSISNEAMPQIAELANENDIPTVGAFQIPEWWSALYTESNFHFRVLSLGFGGYVMGKCLFEAMGGEGNFVKITGPKGIVSTAGRLNGFNRALEEYPDVTRLGEPINGQYLKSGGREAMSTFISQFGNDIDGVWALNDSNAIGAINVLKEENLAGEIPIVGADGVPEARQELARGNLYMSITNLPTWQGGWSLVRAHDIRNGVEYQPLERMIHAGNAPLTGPKTPQSIVSEYQVIPVSRYQEVFEDGIPFDWELMSRAESGENWDPQNQMFPMGLDFMKSTLGWDPSDKPDDFPEAHSNTEKIEQITTQWGNQLNEYPF